VLDELRDAVGADHVLTDPEVVAGYVVDWTGRFRGATPAVVRPGGVDEVARVVQICAAARVALVPQGGNTGLVGGSVPQHGEIVLSLRRLDALGPVDAAAAQVTAGAGVTLGRLQAHARAAGWEYGVDLSARDSATVGGTVATNAGGVHVLRYGSTRRQLVGVQAVFADGSVVDRLDGLEKDNTGYDLGGLLCGSEGTLAVVTAARLRLVPRPRHVVVALLAFDGVDDALAAVGELRQEVDALRALEFFEQRGVDLVRAQMHVPPPFPRDHGAYVLAEAAGGSDPTDALAEAVDRIARVRDVAVATDAHAAAPLWQYREAHSEAINRIGPPHKLDVTLPADRLALFFARIRSVVATVAPDAQVWLFGHAGDGNVHVNVTGVEPDDERVTDVVLRFVAELHGSISAEHGVGVAKRSWVHLTRSPAELQAFRAIKGALDPTGILNPNVLVP
jgi:FAD/FMN-containing dehydrogenase